jgi:hypothetical protein
MTRRLPEPMVVMLVVKKKFTLESIKVNNSLHPLPRPTPMARFSLKN